MVNRMGALLKKRKLYESVIGKFREKEGSGNEWRV